MTQLIKKYFKKITLIIIFFISIYLIIFKINFSKYESKVKISEKRNKFFQSIKEYENFYSPIKLVLSKPQLNQTKETIFSSINFVLFNNKAILADPNVFISLVKDIFKQDDLNKFYNKQNFNNFFLITYAIDIRHLAGFFQVN